MIKEPVKEEVDVSKMINKLVANGHTALDELDDYDQEKIDHIVHQMAMAALDHHMELAELAVEETHRGVVEDKAVKISMLQNIFGTPSKMIKLLA